MRVIPIISIFGFRTTAFVPKSNTHRALQISAVLVSSLQHVVEVNEVIVRANGEHAAICRGHRGMLGIIVSPDKTFNSNLHHDCTHLRSSASLTAARSHQCGSPPGRWSQRPEQTTWNIRGTQRRSIRTYRSSQEITEHQEEHH